MLILYSPAESEVFSDTIQKFLPTLQNAIAQFNSIERARFSEMEIKADVLQSHAQQRIKEGRMPHYLTCFSVSDILMELLNEQGVRSELILIRTKGGKIHIALEVYLGTEKFIIGWSNDKIIFTTEYRYTLLFEQETNDTIAGEFDPINREALIEQLDNPLHHEFLKTRVEHVVRISLSPKSESLMTQKLTLHVDIPGTDDFQYESGMLYRGEQASDLSSKNTSRRNPHQSYHDIMQTMHQTLEGTLSGKNHGVFNSPHSNSGASNQKGAYTFFM